MRVLLGEGWLACTRAAFGCAEDPDADAGRFNALVDAAGRRSAEEDAARRRSAEGTTMSSSAMVTVCVGPGA